MEWTSGAGRKILLQQGDITRIPVDAIVNAANSALAGGGGVDGAIHRAGGPEIMRELDIIRERQGGCPTGQEVCNGRGTPAREIRDPYRGAGLARWAARRTGTTGCLLSQLARTRRGAGCAAHSFPAISAGVYGYPIEQAGRIAIDEIRAHLERPDTAIETAILVLFGRAAFEAYARALA